MPPGAEPLLPPQKYAPSPLRWLVLFSFSLMGALQGMVWVIPGALAANFQAVYGMGQDTVQLLTNYGCIFFIVLAWPSMWALDRFGCRVPILVCIWVMLLCNLCRVIAPNNSSLLSTLLIHFSCILDAVAGPVAMAAPSKLAEDWFPPAERTTATAIGALANQSGTIVVFALVPLLSPTPSAEGMRAVNIFLLALSVFNAAAAALYFPSHPPHPPSASAALARAGGGAALTNASLLAAFAAFSRVPAYVVISAAYSLLMGFSNPQGALVTSNLALLGASQGAAGWVGAGANLASLIVGVAASAATDALKARSRGMYKAALVGSAAAAAGCFIVYAGCFGGVPGLGPAPLWVAAAAFVGANAATGAMIPLGFDLAAEHVFGKGPEAAMLMGIVLPMNAVSLAVLFAPSSSFYSWINWGVGGVGVVAAACLWLWVPQGLPRTEFDDAAEGMNLQAGFLEEGEGE